MKLTIRTLAFLLLVSASVRAQESQDEPRTGKFFHKRYVDFWRTKWADKPTVRGEERTNWKELLLKKDGSKQEYSPPPVVARLLDEPSEENALRYLRWQADRITRIRKAQRLIEQVQLGVKASEVSRQLQTREAPVSIDFYTKEGCPYCTAQKRIFARLAKLLPELSVRTLELTGNPPPPLPLGVTAVPALILRIGDRTIQRVGLTTEGQILTLLKRELSDEGNDDR